MEVVEHVYGVTGSFPRHERFGLAAQMQRAAVSIPSNIAEGHAREHLNEYLHHLSIAHGSLLELETQVEIARRLGYASASSFDTLLEEIDTLSRQLRALRQALELRRGSNSTSHPTPRTSHP
jgi:four helix bundle protein